MLRLKTNQLALIALLLAAGCAREEQPQRPAPPSPVPRALPRAPTASITPAQYVAQASSVDLFLIGASELALRKSSNPRIREFAQIEIAAHKGTSAQLSLEGRRLNLLPSATLNPHHQLMLNDLEHSANFEADYRRAELSVHQQAEALHRRYAATGSSPTLRPVAQVILPIIQRHQRMLKYL